MSRLISEYEEKLAQGLNFYMDSMELLDVIDYYMEVGRVADAEFCVKIALRLHPDDEELKLSNAYILKDQNKWEEAERIVRSLTDQSHRDVQFFYIEELIACGSLEEADRLFWSTLPKSSPSDYTCHQEYAETLMDYNFHHRALKILEQVPETAECFLRILELQGEAYFRVKEYDKSERVLNKSIDIQPYNEVAWTQLAQTQYHAGKLDESEESCNYALTIKPNFNKAQRMRLTALVKSGAQEKAIELAKTMLNDSPTDYFLNMQIGESYKRLEKPECAISYLSTALKYCPLENTERNVICESIGEVFADLGRIDEAIEMYTSADAISGKISSSYTILASIYFDRSKIEKALEVLRHGLANGMISESDYPIIAQILFKEKCFQPARDIWKHIIENAQKVPIELSSLFDFVSSHLDEEP